MSVRYYPIKSVFIQGTIKEKLVYQLCPSTEFSEGIWNLCLVSLSYSNTTTNDYKGIFVISSNVVKSQKFSVSKEVENYDQPLNSFLLDSSLKKNTIYFQKNWFHINAISNEIKFHIRNQTAEDILLNPTIFLHVLFQKIM